MIINKASAISNTLVIYFCCWALTLSAPIPQWIYKFTTMNPFADNWTLDPNWVFFGGLGVMCFSTTIPVSVFFIIVERIYIISNPLSVNMEYRQRLITIIDIATIIAIALINCGYVLTELPLPSKSACLSTGCLLVKTRQFNDNCTRIFFGVLNISAGLIFLFKYWKHTKKTEMENSSSGSTVHIVTSSAKKSIERKNNFVAVLVVLLELCFNLLPNFANFISTTVFGITLSSLFILYNPLCQMFDVICSTFIYSRTLKKYLK
ncbi:hypothetical protein Ddc_11662 [Ditylenchus destructor]|nr:hypothetical protein Ddc_11662 [Ditylenchus destructor]